jgi:hypothetical protein
VIQQSQEKHVVLRRTWNEWVEQMLSIRKEIEETQIEMHDERDRFLQRRNTDCSGAST